METSPGVGHIHWQHTDHHKRDEEAAHHKGHRGHTHPEQVGRGRQEVAALREVEVESDSLRDESSNHHVEGANDDGNHHDEGYRHVLGVDRGHSIHQRADSLLDGMGVEIVSGSDHCVGPHLESIERQQKLVHQLLEVTYISLTADVGAFEFLVIQLFNSSLQIGGSLKFHETRWGSGGDYQISHERLTLCHHDRDRPRNRRRRDLIDVQNLSNPKVPK